jgi:hypothetical protein
VPLALAFSAFRSAEETIVSFNALYYNGSKYTKDAVNRMPDEVSSIDSVKLLKKDNP